MDRWKLRRTKALLGGAVKQTVSSSGYTSQALSSAAPFHERCSSNMSKCSYEPNSLPLMNIPQIEGSSAVLLNYPEVTAGPVHVGYIHVLIFFFFFVLLSSLLSLYKRLAFHASPLLPNIHTPGSDAVFCSPGSISAGEIAAENVCSALCVLAA